MSHKIVHTTVEPSGGGSDVVEGGGERSFRSSRGRVNNLFT